MPRLGEIAGSLGLEFRGDPSTSLTGVASLEAADTGDLSFVAHEKYLSSLGKCHAAALILRQDWAAAWTGPCLLSEHPYLAYARVTHWFDDRPSPSGEIHPTAVIDATATLGRQVSVAPHAVIGAGAVVGDGVSIGAGVSVGDRVEIGHGSVLHPGVVIYHGVALGCDCVVHANTVIGSDGFGFAPVEGRWEKILQLGSVRIGDRCEIGASVSIDRGALSDTVIGDDVIIDNQVHLAHGVTIGEGSALAAAVAIAGSTRVGRRCQFAGQAGLADHIEIGDDVHVAGQGRVSSSIQAPGHYASGTPAQPLADWRRNAIRFTQLDQLARRVKALEKALATGTGTPKADKESDS